MPSATSHDAIKVLDYLRRNRDAEDTVDGIFQWWLRIQHVERNRERVQEALSSLVDKNLVLKRNVGGESTYRLNHQKEEIILALIDWLGD